VAWALGIPTGTWPPHNSSPINAADAKAVAERAIGLSNGDIAELLAWMRT
jgi:hypothetical protein